MKNQNYDINDALGDMVQGFTLDELTELKLANPEERDWYDDLILAKKEQMGIADMGTEWGVPINENTDDEQNNGVLSGADKKADPHRVPINSYNSNNDITVNRNTPGSQGSPDEAFPNNRTAYASPVGETTGASLGLTPAEVCQDNSENELRRVPINENTDADDDLFHYIKIDWFDNGHVSERTNSRRVNARHKINIQFRFDEDSELNHCCGKVCSENRYWKRNIDIDEPFYADVWYWYETFTLQHSPSDGWHYDFKPRLGHIYTKKNERISDAALMFFKFERECAVVKLWIAGVEMMFELFDEQPSGQEKCPALKARYIHKGIATKEKRHPVSFRDAFGN